MKIRKKRRAVWVLLAVMLCFNGCSFGKTSAAFSEDLGKSDVFRIGDTVCTLPKAKVYLCNYQNIYGSAYGINLWEHETDDNSLEEYVKDITISELTRVICMDELAKQQELTLTEEEKKTARTAAKAYYDSLTKEEISYMEISESILEEMYRDYALAQKLYNSLTEGVNDEVSDDEARIMEAQQIYVTTKEKADEVKKELKNEKEFLSVAADYNEAPRIEIKFGRGELPEKVEKAAFALDDDEITKCIEAEDGFYFMKCTNKFNQELTDENKLTIVQQREKEAFDDTYEAFVETLQSVLNTQLWAAVTVEQNENITTDSFFEVYEKYYTE